MAETDVKNGAHGAKESRPVTPLRKNFPAMLEAFKAEISRALPRHSALPRNLSADRMSRIALSAFRRNPRLDECDPRSVFAAVIQASQLGLEPDTLGRAYLVPYKVSKKVGHRWESRLECQFIPGWKGLVELMNRSGQGSAWTGAVFSGDTFQFALGDSPFIRHIPAGEYADEKLIYVYAVGRPRGCEWPIIEAWTMDRIRSHRDRYNNVGDKHYSYQNMEMYARKVVLLQILKYMPLSPDLVRTIELSHAAEAGNQGLTIEGAIDGSWAPPGAEEEETTPIVETGRGVNGLKQSLKTKARQEQAPEQDGGPPMTADEIADSLKQAKSLDELDELADLVPCLPDNARREELSRSYLEARQKFTQAQTQV